MKLSNEVTLSLSDDDFNALVAGALARDVIAAYGCRVEVLDVMPTDSEWRINFVLTELAHAE